MNLFQKCINPVSKVLQDAGVSKSGVHDIVLVGGSTRIPKIQELLSSYFNGKELNKGINPDEAVALGAAVYAAYKANPDNLNQLQKKSISEISLQEISPYYLGTLGIDGATRKEANMVIIPKGEKTPCSFTTTVYTQIENQAAVNCRVTQASSYETDPEFVRIIANDVLNLRPNLPAHSPIEITFSFTEDGHLDALFSDGDGENIHMDLEIKEPLEDEFSIESADDDDSSDSAAESTTESDDLRDDTPPLKTVNLEQPEWILPATQIIVLTMMAIMAVGLLTSTATAIFVK